VALENAGDAVAHGDCCRGGSSVETGRRNAADDETRLSAIYTTREETEGTKFALYMPAWW
jgi:hypothetical protein